MSKNVTRASVFAIVFCVGLAAEAEDLNKVVEGGNEFAVELYGRLARQDGNLFFSPASIHTALGMTYAGARGRTAQQMAETLRLAPAGDKVHQGFAALLNKLNSPGPCRVAEESEGEWKETVKPAYELVMANALWGQKSYPWKEAFLKLTASEYGTGLREVDFATATEAARRTINAWIEKETKKKIKELIPVGSVDELTRMVLTNAIYFSATWAEEFSPRATKDRPFNLAVGEEIVTPLMFQKAHFRYLGTETVQVLEMPYVMGELAMVVVLPRSIDGLPQLESSLSPEMLAGWLQQLRREEVEVTFPKFEFTSAMMLRDTLTTLGMKDAFSASAADFSGMTAEEDIAISDVIHKAFVAVDEKGTEAAAATAVVMVGAAGPLPKPEPKVFQADHPFLFFIRHRATGSILFMGRLVDPTT